MLIRKRGEQRMAEGILSTKREIFTKRKSRPKHKKDQDFMVGSGSESGRSWDRIRIWKLLK
jgi:hypothetical protein